MKHLPSEVLILTFGFSKGLLSWISVRKRFDNPIFVREESNFWKSHAQNIEERPRVGTWSCFLASYIAHQGHRRHGHQDSHRHFKRDPFLRGILILHHRFVVQPRILHWQDMGLVSFISLTSFRRSTLICFAAGSLGCTSCTRSSDCISRMSWQTPW